MHNDVKCVFMICAAQCMFAMRTAVHIKYVQCMFAMRTAAHNKYAQHSACLLCALLHIH